jgi:hypothetical protein
MCGSIRSFLAENNALAHSNECQIFGDLADVFDRGGASLSEGEGVVDVALLGGVGKDLTLNNAHVFVEFCFNDQEPFSLKFLGDLFPGESFRHGFSP